MREEIINKIKELEKEKDVKILFSLESGSRLWGMESKDSDYDVRGIFYRPLKEYLTIRPQRDIIEFQSEDKKLDIVLFDVFKFTKLLSSSNPNLIDWLSSDIVYSGTIPEELINIAKNKFNPRVLYHHYKSMAKRNYLNYINNCALVNYKKYLYVFRGLLNAMYISKFEKVAPIKFVDTVKALELPKEISEELFKIIDIKKKGLEKTNISRIKAFDEFIENELNNDSSEPLNRKNSLYRELDVFAQKLLLGEK